MIRNELSFILPWLRISGLQKKGKEETFQVRTINREKENKNPSNSTPVLWLIAWLEVNYTGIKRGLQSIFSKVEFLKPK